MILNYFITWFVYNLNTSKGTKWSRYNKVSTEYSVINSGYNSSLSSAERLSELRSDGLESLGITTNAVTSNKKLVALRQAGVDSINISLDTLVPAKFELITRRRGWERVMQNINLALELGFNPVKVGV